MAQTGRILAQIPLRESPQIAKAKW